MCSSDLAPYIDIAFAPGAEKKLNLTTITDAGAEFQLIDPDGTSITIASTPTQPEGFEIENKFRFALPSGFEPKVGTYQVKFLTGTWSDTENTTNTAVTEKIIERSRAPRRCPEQVRSESCARHAPAARRPQHDAATPTRVRPLRRGRAAP